MTVKVLVPIEAESIGIGAMPSPAASTGTGGGGSSGAGSSGAGSEDGLLDDDEFLPYVNYTRMPEAATSARPNLNSTNGASDKGSRFGGLAGDVEASVASSMDKHLGSWTAPFPVTAAELSEFSQERTRLALADVLERGVLGDTPAAEVLDVEAPNPQKQVQVDVLRLVASLRAAEEQKQQSEQAPKLQNGDKENGEKGGEGEEVVVSVAVPGIFATSTSTPLITPVEADMNADVAANLLTSVLLRSSPESGIDPREVEHRRTVFGSNAIAEKQTESFCRLCWEAVQDFVLIMLIVLGIISIVVETTTLDEGETCTTCWIEGFAILCSVGIVVLVTAGIDYAKQFAFIRLTKSLNDTNIKAVIRDAHQVSVTDDDVVVGDILSVNSHNLASIPADCVLLGPASDIKVDESALTGESKLVGKKPGDVVLSGTNAVQGSGKMVVIAVGIYSVAGKIKAHVYESEDHEGGLEGDDDKSPLFVKLDTIATRIGVAGTVAATVSFVGSCIIGLGIQGDDPKMVVEYLMTAITVLAVAVPEGLPLAVTLALAFSSSKMMKDQNLVKHLDACETMGCATTICTDKTGTLTANKMTARALYAGKTNYLVDDPSVTLGEWILEGVSASSKMVDLICRCISIDTMNESVLYYNENGDGGVEGAAGNPTEVSLLHLVHDLGADYKEIRNTTKGRSDQGRLGEFLSQGKQIEFTSARKMMSWAVPLEDGRYRLYCKGAQEVIISRCTKYVDGEGNDPELSDSYQDEIRNVALAYARRGMRCLALAYRDLPAGFDLSSKSDAINNSDGTPAVAAETEMTALALVGIEDPLRPEVPPAIEKCYQAGIDVRMVTGDNPNTAVSIAYQAGILRDFHFLDGTEERVATNLKENVLMEGKSFRSKVHRVDEDGKKEFDQASFDKIWPRLRVLARSSPDDKLTLAHGLNQSNVFADKAVCKDLLLEGIKIFPDRQVIAMTGDGTNDAPALKRADIGFAMGISGTQIAKDAADIILLDDNFASIVTAAKWGRNVYASIQKFLQFQLTVNISAVVTALVGSFAYQISPLAAIQLLWVNLLMDSLASLALASEPPLDALLQKPPVNRTDSMITKHMWANMLGHSSYQIIVVMVLLFRGPTFLGIVPGNVVEDNNEGPSLHYTIIFNTFVWMQLFNEINCRKLKGEFNVFKGILDNPLFYTILLVTSALQVLIVEFGSYAFRCYVGGLEGKYWALSIAFGAFELVIQQIINVVYLLCQKYKYYRYRKRSRKAGHLTTEPLNRHGGPSPGARPQHAHQE